MSTSPTAVGDANDIHLDFTFTGGMLTNPQEITPALPPPPAPFPDHGLGAMPVINPGISVSPSGSGIDATWGYSGLQFGSDGVSPVQFAPFGATLPFGGHFEATFDLPDGFTPDFNTGFWTLDGNNIGPVNPFSVVIAPAVPEPNSLFAAGAILATLASARAAWLDFQLLVAT